MMNENLNANKTINCFTLKITIVRSDLQCDFLCEKL